MKGRVREAVARALLVAGSLAALFGLLEIVARLFLPVADIPWHEGDPRLGYRLAPNQSGLWAGEGTTATFRINGAGFNNEHEYTEERLPGRARIAVLGDSYVESLQIDRGRRFFEVLEAGMRSAGRPAEVFTYGVSRYGTGQQLLLLETEVARVHPDLVIVLWVANDLPETACSVSDGAGAPCFTLDLEGRLAHRPPRPHTPNRTARLLMTSALARYGAINLDLVGRWRALRAGRARTHPPWTMSYALAPPPAWEEAWRVVEACLVEMSRFCSAKGIPLLVLHQPILSHQFEAALATVPGGTDASLPGRRLADLARDHGFHFVDLTPAFLADGRVDPDRFLNAGIGHWNPAAHVVVGAALVTPVMNLLGGAAQGVGTGQARTE